MLKRALDKARQAFLETLDGYTLSELARPRDALRALLALAPPGARKSLGGEGRRGVRRTKAGAGV